LLSVIPLLGGAARLLQLASGDASTPSDLRFSAAPTAVTLHHRRGHLYCLVGAFHSSGICVPLACRCTVSSAGWPSLRGIVAALGAVDDDRQRHSARPARRSAVVRTTRGRGRDGRVPRSGCRRHPRGTRPHPFRMDGKSHALAQGAGTQALLLLPLTIAFGEITGLARDLAMTAAWILNSAWSSGSWLTGCRPPRPHDLSSNAAAIRDHS
jgi:hypothetical protein